MHKNTERFERLEEERREYEEMLIKTNEVTFLWLVAKILGKGKR